MARYSLTVNNRSKNYGNICVFQTLPEQPNNILSLAWFSKPAHPNTTVIFEWETEFYFVWDDKGLLVPGVTFEASQVVHADPSNMKKNSISFVKEHKAYKFEKTDKVTPEGILGIYTDYSVPHGEASVGIGMSGKGTFAVTATPNYSFTFRPHPEYKLAFGTYEEGEVLDIQSITNICDVEYGTGVFDMTANLLSDNTWDLD